MVPAARQDGWLSGRVIMPACSMQLSAYRQTPAAPRLLAGTLVNSNSCCDYASEESVQYCCDKCFRDEYLVLQIRRDGVAATCCLCDQRRRRCLDIDTLKRLFEPLVGMYSNVVEYMPIEFLKEGDHPTLSDMLADEWEIFDEPRIARDFLAACCEPYHPKHNPGPDPFDPDQPVGEEDLFFDTEYYQTTVMVERWERLRAELANEKRFFAGRDLIDDLSTTIARMGMLHSARSGLYRARGCEPGKPHARAKMGAPPRR